MHWEDLSQRIAELEKQEQERRERAKVSHEEEQRRLKLLVVFTRQGFHNHRNLQLCFINKSDSEDEEGSDTKVSMGTGPNGCHAAGLKQEVATALRTLRDKLLAEQKEKEHVASSSGVAKRKHLERWELQECSVQQLIGLRGSLQLDVHALSSELVTHLLVRDQLRTKQDAMLLDVQDLT
ncbi:putative schwannomin-interacting protein 1-like [Scophthalmus maximus]|uniref:Putative schwannomin-interacting protein 1-like n=1 Tax=Scophthalmus maximus TaxID=52904 RepID=A0A2U9B6N7_SCOMX|nr:putative schwannomin-interacting protein 1-like [Scophthalmus maximus]